MWPYGILSSHICLSEPCVEYIDIVYLAVAVTVILGKINLVVKKITGIHDHHICALVISVIVVAAVISHIVGKSYRSEEVEFRHELGIALTVGGIVKDAERGYYQLQKESFCFK